MQYYAQYHCSLETPSCVTTGNTELYVMLVYMLLDSKVGPLVIKTCIYSARVKGRTTNNGDLKISRIISRTRLVYY